MPSGQLADLIEAIEQSNIPILVQTYDWSRLPEHFHQKIERQHMVLVEKENLYASSDDSGEAGRNR